MTFYEFDYEPDIDDSEFYPARSCIQAIEADDVESAIGRSSAYEAAEDDRNAAQEGWIFDPVNVTLTHFTVTAHYEVEVTISKTVEGK